MTGARKTLVLRDEKFGVKVYRGSDDSWWVQFIGATRWGRKLYRPTVLRFSVTAEEGARVETLVVQE